MLKTIFIDNIDQIDNYSNVNLIGFNSFCGKISNKYYYKLGVGEKNRNYFFRIASVIKAVSMHIFSLHINFFSTTTRQLIMHAIRTEWNRPEKISLNCTISVLEKLAERPGNYSLPFNLVAIYFHQGDKEYRNNQKKKNEWYQKAVDLGENILQQNDPNLKQFKPLILEGLGIRYLNSDYEKGIRYLEQSAELGNYKMYLELIRRSNSNEMKKEYEDKYRLASEKAEQAGERRFMRTKKAVIS